MTLNLEKDEEILLKAPAALDGSPAKHDGQLFLTNKRLHFEGLEEVSWSYWLSQIRSVKLNNLLFFFSQGIQIVFEDGRTETILVYEREQWVSRILAARSLFDSPLAAVTHTQLDGRLSPAQRTRLRMGLEQTLDEEELRTLCYDLGVDYDNLEGNSKQGKIRELLYWIERTGNLDALVAWYRRERPPFDWEL